MRVLKRQAGLLHFIAAQCFNSDGAFANMPRPPLAPGLPKGSSLPKGFSLPRVAILLTKFERVGA